MTDEATENDINFNETKNSGNMSRDSYANFQNIKQTTSPTAKEPSPRNNFNESMFQSQQSFFLLFVARVGKKVARKRVPPSLSLALSLIQPYLSGLWSLDLLGPRCCSRRPLELPDYR